MRANDGGIPAPPPADTAHLDQLSARWRDAEPPAKEAVGDAAAALQASLSPDSVAGLFDALERAGLYDPSRD
ncbi:hypothetical protein [Streptomyces sp. NPDC020880]|uniref:hypothetical protein n=1 Tax=Streptomyces TaxID=1883 RepID=UPI00384E77F6